MVANSSTTQDERDRSSELKTRAEKYLVRAGFDWNADFPLFLRRQSISRILYLADLYQKVIDVPGYILELGCRWGPSLSIFQALRGIYEPYNYTRGIIGFDTFEGFAGTSGADGSDIFDGGLASDPGHVDELNAVLSLLAQDSPLPHLVESRAIKGDVRATIPAWLDENPHAALAMVVFDMDIYEPTKAALSAVIPRLSAGSLVVFDEFSTKAFPGESLAVFESVALSNIRLERSPLAPTAAWFRWGGARSISE